MAGLGGGFGGSGSMIPAMPRRAAPPAQRTAPPQVLGSGSGSNVASGDPALASMRPGTVGTSVAGNYRVFDANDTAGMHASGWANPFDKADQRGDFYRKIKSQWRVR